MRGGKELYAGQEYFSTQEGLADKSFTMFNKQGVALIAVVAFAVTSAANASVTIDITQDAGPSPFVHALAVAPGDNNPPSETFGPSSENPFDYTATASDSNESGSAQATASLSASFTNASIIATGSFSLGYSVGGDGDGQEEFVVNITVTDQPVFFTLTAFTSASAGGQGLVALEGGTVQILSGDDSIYSASGSLSDPEPQSGTTTGILFPGNFEFVEATNAESGSGSASASGEMEISPVPEPRTWGMFATGMTLLGCLSWHRRRAQISDTTNRL